MTNWKTEPATEKQRNYLRFLIDSRQPQNAEAMLRSIASPTFPKGAASTLITNLKAQPVVENVDPGTQIQQQDNSIDPGNLAEMQNAENETFADYGLKSGGILTLAQLRKTPLWMAEDALADTEDETTKAKIRVDIFNIKALNA